MTFKSTFQRYYELFLCPGSEAIKDVTLFLLDSTELFLAFLNKLGHWVRAYGITSA